MKLTEIQEYFDPSLYEMSNYSAEETGLMPGTKLWIREEPTGLPHTKYRIKIAHPQKGSAVFGIWGDEPKSVAGNWKVSGEDLKRLQALVRKTHNDLRAHIDGKLSSGQLSKVFDMALMENRNE